MKKVMFLVACAAVIVTLMLCTREATYTLFYGDNKNVIVAEDVETMRRLIEYYVAGKPDALPVMDLFVQKKVFLVPAGTRVVVKDAHLFGRNVRIQILEGEYQGKDGWVHKSMLR